MNFGNRKSPSLLSWEKSPKPLFGCYEYMTRRMRKWTFSVACKYKLFCYSLSLPYIKKHSLCTTEKSVIPHRRYVYFYPITKGAFPLLRFMSAPQARVLSFNGIPIGMLFLFCGGKLRKRRNSAFQFMLCRGS